MTLTVFLTPGTLLTAVQSRNLLFCYGLTLSNFVIYLFVHRSVIVTTEGGLGEVAHQMIETGTGGTNETQTANEGGTDHGLCKVLPSLLLFYNVIVISLRFQGAIIKKRS